jgi:hypothetical protein
VTAVSISRFLADPNYLGGDFGAESWSPWKVLLKGAFGELMTDEERERFRELADRDPPGRRVRRLWLAIGRRGGKDRIAAAIAAYLAAFGDFAKHLARGETAVIACLAVDRDQARIVFNYIKSLFTDIPLLRTLLVSAKDDVVSLNNGIQIVVATNTFRGIRGKTIAAAIFDELSFWRDENYSNPDKAVYDAITPSMITLRDAGAMLVAISTTHRASGLLFDKVTEFLGKDDPENLAVLAPSTTFNPTLLAPDAQAEIDRALAEDYERTAAEWLSVWRSDLTDLFDRATILAATDKDVAMRFPRSGVQYTISVDASGGRSDSFAAAVGHVENDFYIVDRLYEKRAPFDPDDALREVADLCREFGTWTVFGDNWSAELLVAGFRRFGVTYKNITVRDKGEEHKLNRSQLYLASLPAFTAGRVRLPHNERLVHQLISIERRPSSSGHDSVDHPRGSGHHDDLANVTAACIVMLATKQRLVVTAEAVAASSNPTAPRPGRARRSLADLPPGTSPQEKMRYMYSSEAVFGSPADPPPTVRMGVSQALLRRSSERGPWTDRGCLHSSFYPHR